MSFSHLLSAKIVSNASTHTWSYVFDFKKDDTSVFILVSKGEGENMPEVIWNGQSPNLVQFKERIAEFEKNFPQTGYYSYVKRFTATTKDLFALHQQHFELVVLVTTGSQLFVASTGSASILLLREGQLVVLNKPVADVATIRGELQAGDVLTVGTAGFIKAVPQGVLKATLTNGNPELIVENLAPGILSLNKPEVACLVLAFTKLTPPKAVESTPAFLQPPPILTKRGIRPRIINLIDTILAKLPDRRFYVNPLERQEARSRKNLPIIIGGILLIALVISVVLGVGRQKQLQVENAFSDKLSVAENKLEEAKTLKGANDARARELLLEANTIITELKDQEGKSDHYELVAQSVSESLGEIGGIYVASPTLYLDLALVSSGFVGEKLAASSGRMLILDRERNKLVSIDIASKKTQIVAGPTDLNNVLDIALYANRNFVIDNSGISEVNGTSSQVINKDWGNNVMILAFAGNLYLLDQDNDKIVRYNGVGKGFAPGVSWIQEGSTGEFSQVKSFTVDGAFWILESNGEVDKWSMGKEEIFLIQGVPNSTFADLYTDEETSDLYLLDSDHSRVIVVNKRGAYLAEYQAPELAEASQLVVSSEDKKIIFLAKSRLYSMELKH